MHYYQNNPLHYCIRDYYFTKTFRFRSPTLLIEANAIIDPKSKSDSHNRHKDTYIGCSFRLEQPSATAFQYSTSTSYLILQ
jgi:hypothetical protein